MSHPQHELLENLCQCIMAQLKERDVEVDKEFMTFVVHLMVRDVRKGLLRTDLNKPNIAQMESFVENIVTGCLDKTHTTMANMRMSWIMKNGHGIKLSHVRQQYEEKYQRQLKLMIDDILQYPETCSKLQLDQLFAKMQIFIVATYHLGCPKNHVLLKLTAMALHSVIGRCDLQNYVLKKKYHRKEYLQRLADTVAGIVIYNNDGPDGDRENVRYLTNDLKMAQSNTSAAFAASIGRMKQLIALCQEEISTQLELDCKDMKLYYRVPLEQLHRINSHTITFNKLMRCLIALQSSYEHTVDLLNVDLGRYDCVVFKINNNLCMRSAIDSELVFPHFVYMAKLWGNLNHYFNHIVELNKLREQVESQVTTEMQDNAIQLIKLISDMGKRRKDMHMRTFKERMDGLDAFKTDGNFCSLANADIKEFCGLALTMTNGLLLPAKIERKLCMNLDITFGFHSESFARIGELCFESFITALRKVIFNNANLASLFDLEDTLIAKELLPVPIEPPKTKDFEGQTEMVVTNDLSVPNWINVTWNVWDYHRETIHLAEIRKRQTHVTQTGITYGRRNAQNQTYNTRHHI